MAAPMSFDDDRSETEKNEISDMFKESFKFYKRKKPPPDFSNVIDFSSGACGTTSKIVPYSLSSSNHNVFGVKSVSQWSAYTLKDVPGFIFINNPFTVKGQWYWVEQCLRYYHCKPYVTNLDKHFTVSDNLWEHHRNCEEGATGEKQSSNKPLMDRLRWATLGYHHDWDTKHYRADHHCPMPEELVLLCRHIAATVGYPSYDPQAAIINYYHMDSTLAGHTDHSEFDLHSPLVSVSFGQPAIFLLGGTSKSQRPHAMYLHSGDVVIMMRESRLAYHAVPRIVSDKNGLPEALNMENEDSKEQLCDSKNETSEEKTSLDNCDISDSKSCRKESRELNIDDRAKQSSDELTDDKSNEQIINQRIERRMKEMDYTDYVDYMKTCRLNMNVRQVLGAGETFPTEGEQNEIRKKIKVT